MTKGSSDDRLDSWKAIARYLSRSVRTVRRWEQQEGLPVHRLMHQSQASVYAFRQELDDWMNTRVQRPADSSPLKQRPGDSSLISQNNQEFHPKSTAAIAVLPFSFAGPEVSQAWVADGLTEEIIGEFSRLSQLRVTSRTSSLAVKDSDLDSKAIAKLLGVSHLLEGSVVGDGQRLRINVRLIEPNRDDHVWSQKFAGRMDEIFDIQERIARDVVDALELRLGPEEEAAIGQPGIENLSAWRRVLLARETAFQWRPDALDQARKLLMEALELTGENATICATMGRVLLHHVEAGTVDRPSVIEEARDWESRARSANPHHPETRILTAWLAHVSGDLENAIDELRVALQSAHDHPDALLLLAHCLLRAGLVEQARPVIKHAMAVDPLTPLTRCFPGYLAAMEGRFDDALEPYKRMLEGDTANPVARLFNVWVNLGAGHADQAIALAKGFEGPAGDSTPAQLARYMVAAHVGNIESQNMPEPVLEAIKNSEMYSRYAAEAWAAAGHAKQAAEWLARAIDLGFFNWPYLATHSPFLSPMADSPELKPVLNRARVRWQALQEREEGNL
ncbi:MAG: tetratricopeptide repeat protein [Wenzhouxiangella sp.]|nr:tetratricopeptide repeat protein [Wenzhouxiangella sp.]